MTQIITHHHIEKLIDISKLPHQKNNITRDLYTAMFTINYTINSMKPGYKTKLRKEYIIGKRYGWKNILSEYWHDIATSVSHLIQPQKYHTFSSFQQLIKSYRASNEYINEAQSHINYLMNNNIAIDLQNNTTLDHVLNLMEIQQHKLTILVEALEFIKQYQGFFRKLPNESIGKLCDEIDDHIALAKQERDAAYIIPGIHKRG